MNIDRIYNKEAGKFCIAPKHSTTKPQSKNTLHAQTKREFVYLFCLILQSQVYFSFKRGEKSHVIFSKFDSIYASKYELNRIHFY